MPMYEIGLPVSSSNLKITHNGVDYTLVLGTETFTRVGKDGNEVILPLCGGCEFIGEFLEGQWKKDWDADIVTYTAMHFRFVEPAAASTRLEVSSSAGGDIGQTLTVTGIVAGAVDTEDFVLNGAVWQNGAKDFTEVWKIELDLVTVGTVTVRDSVPNTIYVLPIGDLLRERFTSLMMGGESDSAGTLRSGWLNNHHPFVMMNDAELTVELEIPTPVTAAPTHDIFFEFYIRDQKAVTTPTDDPNFILVRYFIDENGLILELYKEVGGVNTLLWDGSTANGDDGANPSGDQFWIFRFLFHDAVAGADAPENVRHMHVYAKHGASRATAEAATEEELIDTIGDTESPYDISDLLFKVGYPAYQIISANETWFGTSVGSQLEAISTYLRTRYPALFALKYDFTDAEYGKGDVELWDGDPDVSTSVQVFDEDHEFINDAYLQNSLLRLLIDYKANPVQYGLKLFGYYGAAWVQPFDQLWFNAVTSTEDLQFPTIRHIESISPEKVAIVVRLLDSATVDDDYYLDVRITLERGRYSLKIDSLDVFPDQDVRFWFLNTTTVRFGYVQDDDVGDDDIDEDGDNATPTDNFLIAFDDDEEAVLGVVFTDEDPAGGNARFFAEDGGDLSIEDVDAVDTSGTIIWVSLLPFTLIVNLFIEAEAGNYTGTTPGNDANASPPAGNNYVLLDAIGDFQALTGDYSTYQFNAGTHLPEGRYRAIIRARYEDEETMSMYVWQDTANEYRNEENAKVTKTLAATFGYHSVVFDITAADVSGTRPFVIVAEKSTDDADKIRIDYMLVVPIGDGESFPQDVSHSAMRDLTKPRRLYPR